MSKKPVMDSSYHPNRPPGLEGSSYKTYRNWSYKKWAWEFLRRNHNFQVDCLKVENGTQEEKQQVANDYGLKEFKKYTHAFKGKKSGAPTFLIGVPSIYTNKTNKESQTKRIRLSKTQIAVRFDLKYFDEYQWSIKTQLESLASLFDKKHLEPKSPNDIDGEKFIYLLRLLDCVSNTKNKTTHLQCYLKLNNQTESPAIDMQALQFRVKDHLNSAREISESRYLYYAALKGGPYQTDKA